MVSLILGVLFIAFTVFSLLPNLPLNWGMQVIEFLKGAAPVVTAFLGLVCLFIGIADIKDKLEAKKEEEESNSDSK